MSAPVTIKRWTEDGNSGVAAIDITLDQLEFIYHALRAYDPDLRSYELEDKIGQLL